MKYTIMILSIFLSMISHNCFTQDIKTDTTALPYLQKAEFNVFGVGVAYELPVAKGFTLDSGMGFSSGAEIINNKIKFQKSLFEPAFYLKSELKYYYNRYVRVAKKLSTRNGEGSYFAIQNKFVSQRLFDSKTRLSNVLLYEVHWGIQRNLYKNFLFNFHIGLGRSNDFTTGGSTFYTSLGVKVSYLLVAKKITISSFGKNKF
ncbi:MAG: hypothetical protein RSE15_10890 [Flavobacterium sp.]|uniref:hypothetical protein n=1 Tax=Flavobacterium sp. TaxID=239 RepID=UPI002B4AA718|nr:hypothetical protein [Flavobacterium sp.]WRH72856.1 MAG: hypothetical protein RSE15_10890 [Flavobacterium sp.]